MAHETIIITDNREGILKEGVYQSSAPDCTITVTFIKPGMLIALCFIEAPNVRAMSNILATFVNGTELLKKVRQVTDDDRRIVLKRARVTDNEEGRMENWLTHLGFGLLAGDSRPQPLANNIPGGLSGAHLFVDSEEGDYEFDDLDDDEDF